MVKFKAYALFKRFLLPIYHLLSYLYYPQNFASQKVDEATKYFFDKMKRFPPP